MFCWWNLIESDLGDSVYGRQLWKISDVFDKNYELCFNDGIEKNKLCDNCEM